MERKNWTFMLRLLRWDPDRVPMARLGEYIQEFAALLGDENHPVFKGVKKASTGLKAFVPPGREHLSRARIVEAKSNPNSKPARHLRALETMLGDDLLQEAQIIDVHDNVIYLLRGVHDFNIECPRIHQEGTVDGVVTGLVGADRSMHLHLRDSFDRDLRLTVYDVPLARELLLRFRIGSVRVHVRGDWVRTDTGWAPEASRCTVTRFEVLEDAPLTQVFEALSRIRGNGWKELEDPLRDWENLRGLH